MKKTRICRLLNIAYPVIQGGMLWIATAELASAVSNAGGLGVISPMAGMAADADSVENLKHQIRKTRQMTPRSFGVNIPLDLADAGRLIPLLIDEQVQIVITAAGDPTYFTKLLKSTGMKVIHVVSNVSQAKSAASAGVDAIIAEGFEAAGHNGKDELPLFSLIPQVVEAIRLPVIAAGGIVDARGFVAAFCLGAEGIQMGTRFVTTKENIAHTNYKLAICNSKDTDTVVTCRRTIPARSLKSAFTNKLTKLESSINQDKDLFAFIGYRSNLNAQIKGDLTAGEAFCGSSAGLIKKIIPVSTVMKQLVHGYDKIRARL